MNLNLLPRRPLTPFPPLKGFVQGVDDHGEGVGKGSRRDAPHFDEFNHNLLGHLQEQFFPGGQGRGRFFVPGHGCASLWG